MKKILALSTALTFGIMSPALAGNPAPPPMEPVVIVDDTSSSSAAGIVVPVLAILLIGAALLDNKTTGPTFPVVCDRRLKTDIRATGRMHRGIPIYQWRYKGLESVWEGPMAQDVAILHPGAVKKLPTGYLGVDMAAIGYEMKRIAA